MSKDTAKTGYSFAIPQQMSTGQEAGNREAQDRKQGNPPTINFEWLANALETRQQASTPTDDINRSHLNSNSKPVHAHTNLYEKSQMSNGHREIDLEGCGSESATLAGSDSMPWPPNGTTRVHSQTRRGVVDSGPGGHGMQRLTRAQARQAGVLVQPALAQDWKDYNKPYFI